MVNGELSLVFRFFWFVVCVRFKILLKLIACGLKNIPSTSQANDQREFAYAHLALFTIQASEASVFTRVRILIYYYIILEFLAW